MIQIILIFIEINSKIQISYFQVFSINRYNPYFIGINSAIESLEDRKEEIKESQSLFYWN